MSNISFILRINFLVIILVLFFNCSKKYENEIFSALYEKEKWANYKNLYEELTSIDDKILWADEVYNFFIGSDKSSELIKYYDSILLTDEEPAFKYYIYFLISNIHWSDNEKDEALFFMYKVDQSVYNLKYNNQFIGYTIALRFIGSEVNIRLKERMYKILINNYRDLIDVPYTLYEMSNLYKRNYESERYIDSLKKIIEEFRTNKALESSVDLKKIKYELDYYYLKKNWINKDLEALIGDIKRAIKLKDINLLYRYASKTNFEAYVSQKSSQKKSWSFWELDINRYWYTNIVFSGKLEPQSNENEAIIKTMNWGFPQITTWYFYFKRINYPIDDKIDRGWEWAGIYYGDMF
ncbi:MAG: hypothetical protein KA885_06135 [Spirochaetes bacterium]|nr:hypothetical protein [Spirochaetota bacterium]